MFNIFFRTYFVFLIPLLLFSCYSKNLEHSRGSIQQLTRFYDTAGNTVFTLYLKKFYLDKVAIQELRGVNTVTDTANNTTVTYPVLFYRYIDLNEKKIYDYKNFSDTAKAFKQVALPDSLMLDGGWSFYSSKAWKIKGIPLLLKDTMIDNLNYKRAKFYFSSYDPQKDFFIGFLRCDNKPELFSLEKDFSKSLNCNMVKIFHYNVGRLMPYASRENFYLSDTLSVEEIKVFKAWKKNAQKN